MGRIIDDLRNRYRNENIVGKYIYINVAVYLIIAFVGVFATLFNAVLPIAEVVSLLELPASLGELLYQPWSLLTYMFMHEGFMHIMWNMLALYGFGRIFLNFYSTRHFIGVYFLGGIIGGLFFVGAYNIFPYFAPIVDGAHLVGASAAIMAVIVAAALRSPNTTVNLLILGPMRLITLAAITVVVSVLLLSSDNAGGNFAHLGGALTGAIFSIMLNKGHDVTTLINVAGDFFSKMLTKIRGALKRKPKMRFTRTEGAAKHSADYEYNARRREKEDEMNEILEKVKRSGYSSLTDDEKKRLFDSSQK